jgi:hypothetical protein
MLLLYLEDYDKKFSLINSYNIKKIILKAKLHKVFIALF